MLLSACPSNHHHHQCQGYCGTTMGPLQASAGISFATMPPSWILQVLSSLTFLSTLLFQMMTIIIIIFSVAGLESNVANLTRQFVERVKNQAKHYHDRDFED